MAGKRLETMDLRQLITLKKQGLSNRKIGLMLQISRNTVNGYAQVLKSLGNDYDHLLALDDLALKELCAPESEVSADRYEDLANQFEYFSAELKKPGCTLLTFSDGLKSAVSKSCKYEPVINKTFKDFALHYGCVVDPARPYSAQDKALVEGAVKLVYQRIFYPLSKMTFFSIAELNAAIRELLVKYNNYVFQLTSYSRKELFLSTEKQYLKPLPATPYELRQYRRAKVQKMGYIFLSEDKHYYSVPYRFIGKHVEVRYTQSAVEIFYNHERLCIHKRDRQPGQYSTQKDHLSSAHKAYSEWSLPFFQRKAENVGPETVNYITRVILQYSYPEIGYKQAMGIIQLTRLYDMTRIEKACRRALTLEHCSFRTIDNILRTGSDQLEIQLGDNNHIPEHENIRGGNHYQ